MDRNEGVDRWLTWPLRMLAVPYGLAVLARAACYNRGWLPRRQLSCRVISVGNLTVGGTGKTPVVIWLVESLLAKGLRVGVLSRGYKRERGDQFLLVSDGAAVLAGPAEAGDEPHLIATRCRRAIVAVGADRYRLGRWVQERFPIDCFVLDDGFQHLALYRDADLLLVDASDPHGLEALLPAGRLREPLSAAARATALLVTRADQAGDLGSVLAKIEAASGRKDHPVLVRFRVDGLADVRSGGLHEIGRAKGQRALIFSGIGNSPSFKNTVAELGAVILDEVTFRDHHVYQASDLAMVRERARRCGAELILTTEKDAGKVTPLLKESDPVLAVRLDTEIMEGRELLGKVLSFQ
ncbi:MAG: tetraacyldisaccharide 4'-kinase [Nitrospira sp.]|nr:tetraacyldisaccharide 4'-kinase [Nitrospira sp.]